MTVLVGISFTAAAKTLDHKQFLETRLASHGDFGGDKHLSKGHAHSGRIISQHPGRLNSKYDVLDLGQRSSNIKKMSVQDFPCPNATDIAPCLCSVTESNELDLDCSSVESYNQLTEVFRQDFPVKEFNEFRIENNDNIQYLADIFRGVSFRYIFLNIMQNLIQIENYAFFDSRNTLENIYISRTALDEKHFPFDTLDQFVTLSSLSVTRSNVTYWPAFNSTSIKSISFSSNYVSALPSGAKYVRIFSNITII